MGPRPATRRSLHVSAAQSPVPGESIVRVRDPGHGHSRRVRKLFGHVGLVALVYASFVAVEFPADGDAGPVRNERGGGLLADHDEDQDPRVPTG